MKTYIVQAVGSVVADGLYNPQTAHGNIVVDGVLCSTFTSAIHPLLAKTLLLPLVLASKLGLYLPSLSKAFDHGVPKLIVGLTQQSVRFEL